MKNFLSGRVLIIDDDAGVVDLIRLSLMRIDYSADVFISADHALFEVDFADYDAIICEMHLGSMNAIELARDVRQKDPALPVIIVTRQTDVESAITAIKEGVFDYVKKPFSPEQIAISVRKAAEKRRIKNENRYYTTLLEEKNAELNELNRKINKRNEQLESDLQIARMLQDCLFPMVNPEIDDWDIQHRVKSFEKISGDFFHFDRFEDGFGLMLADVSGHGIAASLYSAIVKAALMSIDLEKSSPGRIIASMNDFLLRAHQRMSYSYVAAAYLRFYTRENRIEYSNCGMPYPVILSQDGRVQKLQTNGPLVGIFEGMLFGQDEVSYRKGDSIMLFTDGVYEYYNNQDTIEGYNTLVDRIISLKNESLSAIIGDVFDRALESAVTDHRDDITILGMRYHGG